MRTYTAHFRPEAWQNDNAIPVDPQGPTRWEVSPAYLYELMAGLEGGWLLLYETGYEADQLRHDPAAPEWIREWQGPFSVSLERDTMPIGGTGLVTRPPTFLPPEDELPGPNV
jgi:hypothetical protein